MKRIFFLVLIAMTMSLALVSCGGSGSSSENNAILSDITTEYLKIIQKGDCEKLWDFMIEYSDMIPQDAKEEEIEIMKSAAIEACKLAQEEILESKEGIKNFKIEKEEISANGMTATVYATITIESGSTHTSTIRYKKVDGKWQYNGEEIE